MKMKLTWTTDMPADEANRFIHLIGQVHAQMYAASNVAEKGLRHDGRYVGKLNEIKLEIDPED